MPVIDGCTMFNCSHEFVAIEDGFTCVNCNHRRDELSVDQRKALIFFPVSIQAVQHQTVSAVAGSLSLK